MDNQTFTQEDIQENKTVAPLAYLIFFLPMLAAKDSPFARFHGNQGLLLFLAGLGVSVASNVLAAILGILAPVVWALSSLAALGIFIIGLLAFINTLNGKADPLPFIGHINLINK